jgi:predicted N-acyltransferase
LNKQILVLINSFSFKIFASADELPDSWNNLSTTNIFLSKNYLRVLENSAPSNMICNFIGLFEAENLVGIALSQMVTSIGVSSSGEKKSCIKSKIRDLVFKRFASNVLLIGNNMLTGQNAFYFSEKLSFKNGIILLEKATLQLQENFKSQGKKIHLTSYKDFDLLDSKNFKNKTFSDYYQFEIQPNMVFEIPENWHSNDDYILALSKKYRDQYKRSHKKADGIIKYKLSLEEIILHNSRIFELYLNVTQNAPFNTFYLKVNHFIEFKKQLGHNFLFYGYFIDEKLIGFNTLIKNGNTIDTYFLGYDDAIQREKMLYLNMLYDMIGYSINKKFKKIIFARTALEIKSSVGAKPEKMFGFVKHHNKFINKFMPKLFDYFDPKVVWQERNPFK